MDYTKTVEFTQDELLFLEDALNSYWHASNKAIELRPLGDIEKANIIANRDKAILLMRKLGMLSDTPPSIPAKLDSNPKAFK